MTFYESWIQFIVLVEVHLDDARLFLTIASSKSLSQAARRLDRSVAAVSATLRRLEELTDVQLVRRSTRAMTLTAEGRDFAQTCTELLSACEPGERRLGAARDRLVGTLRVAAPVDIAHQHLATVIADFAQQHPELTVTLLADDAFAALPGEDVDVVLRYGKLEDSSLVSVRIGATPRLVVASPDLLQQAGFPTHPSELANLPTLA